MSGWRKIGSAPRDGTLILAAVSVPFKEGIYFLCRWKDELQWFVQPDALHGDETPCICFPTHWRPLPKGPPHEETQTFKDYIKTLNQMIVGDHIGLDGEVYGHRH